MLNKFVNSDVAHALKNMYNVGCMYCYDTHNSKPLPFNAGTQLHYNFSHNYFSAPSISDIVSWLYEYYDIWVWVGKIRDKELNKVYWQYFIDSNVLYTKEELSWDSPDKAYQHALIHALTIISKEKML